MAEYALQQKVAGQDTDTASSSKDDKNSPIHGLADSIAEKKHLNE